MLENEFNKFLISELEQMKEDLRTNFCEVRIDIRDLREVIYEHTNKFITHKTFWKVVGIISTVIFAAFSYTTIVWQYLLK